MMVGEGMGMYGKTKLAQRPEESLRVADAADRVHGRSPKGIQGFGALVGYVSRRSGDQSHGVFAFIAFAIAREIPRWHVPYHEIHCGQSRYRLSQRARRQAAAIAMAQDPIHHGDFQIPRQGIVLQAIVAEDQIAIGRFHGCFDRRDPIRRREHRASGAPRQQHGLIPHPIRVAIGFDPLWPVAGLSTIAARHDCRAKAPV